MGTVGSSTPGADISPSALLGFIVGTGPAAETGFRIIGAHTDSPGLRLKPSCEISRRGYSQLGVETYGGLLDYSILDRDLGLAGTVVCQDDDGITERLFAVQRPLLRIPSLAIHLNRGLRDDGLKLNAQEHLTPLFGLVGDSGEVDGDSSKSQTQSLNRFIAAELDISPKAIVGFELSLVDVQPPTLGGVGEEFIFAPRLDNQAMCHAAVTALVRAADAGTLSATAVICLYDHEEVGSSSTTGAGGALAVDVLRRLAEIGGPGASVGAIGRAAARSLQVSADMAHAVHPNYADKHDPEHLPRINGGPVIKINANQRYATSARGAAVFGAICERAGVPCQRYVNRSDLPCGSTIGPISAAALGIDTIDVGNPMLSMHSIREQAGSRDPELMTAALAELLVGQPLGQ